MMLIELVPKKRKLGPCDQCGDTQAVREYFLPYGKGHSEGRYRDLCQTCQRRIGATRPHYITSDTDLPRFGLARRELRVYG